MITSFFAPTKNKAKGKMATTVSSPKKRCREESSESIVVSLASTTTPTTLSSSECAKRVRPDATLEFQTQQPRRVSDIQEPPPPSSLSLSSLSSYSPAVEELISSLHCEQWKRALSKHFASASFGNLATFVARERANKDLTIYPPPRDTWTALNVTPLDQVKVVIVGQDPYHGPQQAHGLCFSVQHPGQAIPPSLKNIHKELLTNGVISRIPTHGNLLPWAQQGVLMLNAVMTVRRGQANSHKNQGWETTTDEILKALLSRKQQEDDKGIVFLLWGKPAASKALSVLGKASTDSKKYVILTTSHPSPLGASKTNQPFLTSRCFVRCNEALQRMGHEPIDWTL